VEIRELTKRVYEFSTLAVRYRIQAEVLRLANLSSRCGNVVNISPAPTHAEIASRTSTHREAVTRELNRLAKLAFLSNEIASFGLPISTGWRHSFTTCRWRIVCGNCKILQRMVFTYFFCPPSLPMVRVRVQQPYRISTKRWAAVLLRV